MSIIRSVTNIGLNTLHLFIPGYDTLKPAVTIAPSATLDLFTVLDAEELSAIQIELVRMVAEGSLAVAATADSSVTTISGVPQNAGQSQQSGVAANFGPTT